MSLFGALRSPQNIVFGAGQRSSVGVYAAALGSRALVVTDERLRAAPEFQELIENVEAAGVRTEIFDGTVAELPLDCIYRGAEKGRSFGNDIVIGIGGGSCLDAAKAIAVLLSHGGVLPDYYGEFKVPGPVMPLVLLPTTSGTGSEVTPVAVVTDPERSVKVGIASPHIIAHTAICDPELTYSCPAGLTAISGADALTHAIEAYTTAKREPTGSLIHEHVFIGKNALSDAHALTAISHLSGGLKRAYDDGRDIEARAQVMLGATMAGLAFGTAGTAAAHAVQYPVGALTHTPHGTGVALMMPYVMEFNRPFCEQELAEIGEAMGIDSVDGSLSIRAAGAIDAVQSLFASLGIPRSLADIGVTQADIPKIAELAMGSARLIKNNPRPLELTTMTELVDAAFSGDRARLSAPTRNRKAG